MEKKTNKEIGKILANETLNVSIMQMEATGAKVLDKQYWAMFHLGFIACMKLNGSSDDDINEVIDVAQENLKYDNYGKN